jgi:hypothetical protein
MDTYLFNIRNERDGLLYKTDKYMLPDYPITPENLEKMKIYRQELRDFFQKDELINIPSPLKLPVFPF